ncbi:MAG: hypothetical protein CL932_14230 [Deltaproteobacteria bacterium]|nr:hypothetical protein [Deltaproteobacteria bacterium]
MSSAWGFEKREQEPPQSERTLVQLPLLNFVGKGSDTYPSHISQMFVHIGRIIPPLSSLERRKEPEAQGGEFVEADDCKAYEANQPRRKASARRAL